MARMPGEGRVCGDGRRFDLIETMRFDPHEGIVELDRHLARMKRSADALGFAFDRHHARNELQAATFFLREARKLRLLLSQQRRAGDRIAAVAGGAGRSRSRWRWRRCRSSRRISG